MKIATPFGLIWAGLVLASGMVASVGLQTVSAMYPRDVAQATTTWLALDAVHNGLGGGIEVVGGLWALLIGLATWRSAADPRPLAALGIAVGLCGILTLLPPLRGLGAVFGLTQIAWFAWLGAILLRGPGGTAAT